MKSHKPRIFADQRLHLGMREFPEAQVFKALSKGATYAAPMEWNTFSSAISNTKTVPVTATNMAK
ncbi:hypothetical protein BraRD5C2_67550 [Bradyrhizobium sp. RD5-C2]|nr:hypothetical protein BraRD5C2_67550 [Bradyrhizobium sp. RD5-C2]